MPLHPDAKTLDQIVKQIARTHARGAITRAAEALAVSYHRFCNWRKRGVPAAYRARVMALANSYGADLSLSWLDVARPSASTSSEGKTNGRKSEGKRKAAKGRKGQGKVQRRRAQQRRGAGRGAAALVG